MTTLLFPGRHLLQTEFQRTYLQQIVQAPFSQLAWHGAVPALPPIDNIIFAITSCNQQNSRYNSIPFHVRAIGVDRFARELQASLDFEYRIIGIPHYRPTKRFCANVIKEIEAQTEGSEGSTQLTPKDCVVLCSTNAVIAQYEEMGFNILPAELGEKDAMTPVDVLKHFVAIGNNWSTDPVMRKNMSATSHDLWNDFPDVPRRALRLWRDPLLNDSGSLTETRDYSTYAYEMAKPAAIRLKYDDIHGAIKPGKIVEEGCADGAMLSLIAKDFPDSDLIGIELTGEFLARCNERQRAGDFGGTFVHFHQRNIMNPIFAANSIDTTICNSTIHELWSYGEQASTVDKYLQLKFEQTAHGGRLVVRDVVGPGNKDCEVHMRLNEADGSNDDPLKQFSDSKELEEHLNGLSTYGRFVRFAHDYLRELREAGRREPFTKVEFVETSIDGERYIVLPLRHAAEFISKMTYTHNWASEMYEEFTFWDFSEWCAAFQAAGFSVVDSQSYDSPLDGSRAYCNPWIVENRYRKKVELFERQNGRLERIEYPPTNIVIVGRKEGAGIGTS